LIGTFTCSCGFTYARKQATDMFELGRVKAFGEVWHQRLNELSNDTLSIRAMARELGVDSKTVKKYLEQPLKESELQICPIPTSQLLLYRAEFIEIMQNNPQFSRSQLRKAYQKQYMYLYRH